MDSCTLSLSDICLDGVPCSYASVFVDEAFARAPMGGIEIVLPHDTATHAIAAFNKRKITPVIFNDVLTLCDYIGVTNTPSFVLSCVIFDECPKTAYALAPRHQNRYQTLYDDICSLGDDGVRTATTLGCVAWLEHYEMA